MTKMDNDIWVVDCCAVLAFARNEKRAPSEEKREEEEGEERWKKGQVGRRVASASSSASSIVVVELSCVLYNVNLKKKCFSTV